ncbi:MAG: hypothetical protein HY915_14950 [Desulfovibrio sp.]|nr:hypothetical protein [Desulfovibrio sp.]
MAGEEAGKETQTQDTEAVLEEFKGPDDEGSLASIIEQSRHQVLTEHPTAGGMGAFEPKPEEKEEETPLPEEIPTETEDDKPPAETTPPETEFKPKHQTWEETEKARIEAEQKMHAATEEAANLRKELGERQEKGAEKETPEPPEPPAEAPKPVTKEERKERVKTALATIRDLDEGDPDYDEKVAEAWAEAGVGGSEVPVPDKNEIAKLVAQQVREELKAEDETKRQKDEVVRQEQVDADARTKAEELATEAGLNMGKGTADHRLFWDVARELPEELKPKPNASATELEKLFPDQVKWVVGEVRRLKGEIVQGKPGTDGQVRELQRQNAVLERGSTRSMQTKKPSEPENYTLGGIINQQMNQRRI